MTRKIMMVGETMALPATFVNLGRRMGGGTLSVGMFDTHTTHLLALVRQTCHTLLNSVLA